MKPALYLPLVLLMIACSNSLSTESNPGTMTINFDLPEDTHVKLWIENSYHTDVKTLLNKNMPQGIHSVAWDTKDDNGDLVPSGLYIYHIKTDEIHSSRTMLLDRDYDPYNR